MNGLPAVPDKLEQYLRVLVAVEDKMEECHPVDDYELKMGELDAYKQSSLEWGISENEFYDSLSEVVMSDLEGYGERLSLVETVKEGSKHGCNIGLLSGAVGGVYMSVAKYGLLGLLSAPLYGCLTALVGGAAGLAVGGMCAVPVFLAKALYDYYVHSDEGDESFEELVLEFSTAIDSRDDQLLVELQVSSGFNIDHDAVVEVAIENSE